MFLDPHDFAFTTELEANWQVIRDEYCSLPDDAFDPWVQRQMHGGSWSVYGLFAFGQRIERACDRCPRTAEILQAIPGISLAGFSRLAPGAHIERHVGWAKTVYRLHLGLVVPPNCRLRVGNETRHWHDGKCLIFDDTVEHEAWNESDQSRGTLMLDFARPGITQLDDPIPPEVEAYARRLAGKAYNN